jgi:hypothetical protein
MFALITLLTCALSGTGADPKLPADDARYLDKLIADFLFDPTGAERVTGTFPSASVYGYTNTGARDGWLVRGKGGDGNRVFFTDGYSEPAPREFTGVDFVAACRARYAPRPEQETQEEAEERTRQSAGVNEEPDLVLAAWLHKLGHDDLAGQALAAARKVAADARGAGDPDPRELLRDELADRAFVELLSAYRNRTDEAALTHGTRLFKLYKDLVRRNDKRYGQAERVLAEVQKRLAEGRAGLGGKRLALGDLPADPKKRVAALLSALDEADGDVWRHQLDLHLPGDWRIRELAWCGEAAVPALLDAYETDTRLTRLISINRFDDFIYEARAMRETDLVVRPVRDAALLALECILRVRVFEPTVKGAQLDLRDKRTPAERAAALRRYWGEYGKLPFGERMMKVLTAPEANALACREAATNLAALGRGCPSGWLGPLLFTHPTVKKFARPTAAEALIAVLDRERKEALATEELEARERAVYAAEKVYLRALVAIGDPRAARMLADRAVAATDINTRRRFAAAAFRLGEPKPLDDLARAFEAGTLTIRETVKRDWRNGTYNAGDFWNLDDVGDLTDLVRVLSVAGTPAADQALRALGDPRHPYHKAASTALLRACGHHELDWFGHPYWFALARPMFDDATETGRVYKITNRGLEYTGPGNSYGVRGIPDFLRDPKLVRDEAAERIRDRLATEVSEALVGAPPYHPLRTDCDTARRALNEMLGRFDGRLRRVTAAEAKKLSVAGWGAFIPNIKPLNRAATADDVALGDAVFSLNGKGKPSDVALPAWVTLNDKRKTCGLAVQAETGPDGVTVYGVIFAQDMRAVPATEVAQVESVAKK